MICLNHSRLDDMGRDVHEAKQLLHLLESGDSPLYLRKLIWTCDLTAHGKHIEAVDQWMCKHFREEQYAWTIGWDEDIDTDDVHEGLALCLMVNLGKPKGCPDEGDLFAVLLFEMDKARVGIGTPHLMRFELHAHSVNRKRCSLMAEHTYNTERLFQCYAFPLVDDKTAHWREAWKSNHDSRMLRMVFDELRKTASMDITPNDSEFEVESAYKISEDILAFVDMVYSGGRSIDWKMRLRKC